ncbi:MAG: SDR family NAD(P)-dependent oxidoreductase [Pseudomonadota bacterium]
MASPDNRRMDGPVRAIMTAIRDIRDTDGLIDPVPEHISMAEKTCLITGANSGLGYAIAEDLARRGARLILACRSDIPEAADDLIHVSGNQNITMEYVDLLDLRSVDALCDRLVAAGTKLDRLILNAGLMAPRAEPSAQGFEKMLAVHFLANQRLATRLVELGVIARTTEPTRPRIIAVSSESHRSAPPIDFEELGKLIPHKTSGAMKQYGHSKLALSLMIRGLAARYRAADGTPEIDVFHMCPGPVASNIARDAPSLIRPLANGMIHTFFPGPAKAAQPVIHLACSDNVSGKSGAYMHLMRFKDPSNSAMDDDAATRVIEFGERVFSELQTGQSHGQA